MSRATASTVRLCTLDRPAIASHFLALEREDRRLRFGSALPDEALRDYVARMDFERDGLFGVQDEALALAAVVHVACSGAAAELGLSVRPEWRGMGLGTALFGRAATFLRNRGIASVFIHCLAENAAMMRIARRQGMRLAFSGAESEAMLELPPATPDSLRSEWFEDQRARTIQAVRRNARIAQLVFSPPAARVP